MTKEIINLPMVNLSPTMKCNLKCRLCGVLVPQYDYRPQMTAEEFSTTLRALFSIADNVGKLQITGGEPLLHPKLSDILSECFCYESQFEELWLFTNCAVPINQNVIKILYKYKYKVLIHASDYGVKPEVTGEVIETLKKNSIPYRYLKYYGTDQYADGWVDQGDFVAHGRPALELKEIFSNCPHVTRGGSWYIRNGQMHWCGRSIRGVEVGKIPPCEDDYMDIMNGTIEFRRKKLQSLMKAEYITACDYCNGCYGTIDKRKRQPAGEQI